ncbi:MAG: phosphotransferase [Thermoflavifilum sp.]|nr:phosphotransferase [Thermoflavifilum sp.]MCL6512824.1 phosphotransferase [Alicyclobacillus sp.]
MRATQAALPDEMWRHLPEVIQQTYGVRVQAMVRMRSVIGLLLADGRRWVWKRARPFDSEMRLADVAAACRRLRAAGIVAAGPVPTSSGRYLVDVAGCSGYVQPWLRGRHVDGGARDEQDDVLTAIGRMHACLRQEAQHWHVVPDPWPLRRKLHTKWSLFRRNLRMGALALPALAEYTPRLEARAEAAMQALTGGDAWSAYERRRTVCHRDLALHNMLHLAPRRIALIDFDQTAPDDALGDVLQVVHHLVYSRLPKPGDLKRWVSVYVASSGLSAGDEARLWRLLAFPDLAVRTLCDWADAGYPEQAKTRVLAACRAEDVKAAVLAVDSAH